MLLTSLGEFGLIKRFRKQIKTDSSVVVGSGDDCAVLEFDKTRYQLFTCDMIVEGVDFTPKEKPELIGRKALAVSVSDIAACGGIPRHAVVSLGFSKQTKVSYLDKIVKGISGLAKSYKINIVGGDISRAKCLTIDVSMLGVVEKKRLVLRSGANLKDLILVSGPLGGSICGKHLTFTPRVKESRYLTGNFKVNAMIDISDGLLQDLAHILEKSNTGALLYESLIPLSKDAKDISDALTGGEDFELLFTMPFSEAEKLLKKKNTGFYPIGEVREKSFGFKLQRLNGACEKVKAARAGFRHF